jgi:RHS repeat-associated protein
VAGTDYGFTGQREEAYIDLIEMGARWYDSSLGRWLSADTIVPDPGNPQSLNRYSYVYNNPVSYVDPSGHMPYFITIDGDSVWYLLSTLPKESDQGGSPAPTRTPTPTPQSTATPTPGAAQDSRLPEPIEGYSLDEVAVARMISLEAGGEHVFGENLRNVREAMAWVVINRKNYERWWDGSIAEIASSTEFEAVSNDLDHVPPAEALDVARRVLSGEVADRTGGSVFFHDARYEPGDYSYMVQGTAPWWAEYFYTSEQCPGGPVPGYGCPH